MKIQRQQKNGKKYKIEMLKIIKNKKRINMLKA